LQWRTQRPGENEQVAKAPGPMTIKTVFAKPMRNDPSFACSRTDRAARHHHRRHHRHPADGCRRPE